MYTVSVSGAGTREMERCVKNFFHFRQAATLSEKAMGRELNFKYGVTPPSLEILLVLKGSKAPVSGYKLAQVIGKEHHSVIEIVNRMTRKGLLKRKPGEGVILADKGLTLTNDILRDKNLWVNFLPAEPEVLRQRAMKSLGLFDKGTFELELGLK